MINISENKLLFNSGESEKYLPEGIIRQPAKCAPGVRLNSDNADSGLAKLVMTLIELIRKLVEKQAMRRIDGGLLSEEEIERLGETLMKLEKKMEELKKHFNLTDSDLNINLGPLGDLI